MTALAALALALAAQGPLPDSVLPNDNRAAAGVLRDGVREIRLEARTARWRPDLAVDSLVTVLAFAEPGGVPRIPGPLVRERAGTELRISLRNTLDDGLVVHGLRPGFAGFDTLHVAAGAVREVRFRASAPGTFLYWGSTTGEPMSVRSLRDAQLTGAIVIDPAEGAIDEAERIFVMTVIDVFPGDSVRNPRGEDIWELAINGRSWPHTERFAFTVGDTVRWRWLNGTYLPHPMHLHGFHFRVLAQGDGYRETVFPPAPERLAVTQFMPPGSTFRMEWVPTRAGSWLMHCHMIPHITPFPERDGAAQSHDLHDVEAHPLQGMAGLVLGITVTDRAGTPPEAIPTGSRALRLFAQRAPADGSRSRASAYLLQQGDDAPRADSVVVPSSTLLLTRGESTAITVHNRLDEPTTVHWHGLELLSVFDGVAGWSRTGGSIAPLLAPGDSFTVVLTPPRAGTYIYHTHMDEGLQLPTGMYGPLLVLEPGQAYVPETDRVFLFGRVADGDSTTFALNGRTAPHEILVDDGRTYRFRFINMLPAEAIRIAILGDDGPLAWRPVAKDGADLAPELRTPAPAILHRIGVGETYDFEFTPARGVSAVLELRVGPQQVPVRYPIRVR